MMLNKYIIFLLNYFYGTESTIGAIRTGVDDGKAARAGTTGLLGFVQKTCFMYRQKPPAQQIFIKCKFLFLSELILEFYYFDFGIEIDINV